MYRRNACLSRAINTLAADLGSSSTTLHRPQSEHLHSPYTLPFLSSFLRHGSTLRSISKGHHRRALFDALKKKTPAPVRDRQLAGKAFRRDVVAREHNRARLSTDPLERQAQLEAEYLKDPLRLSMDVVQKLRDAKIEEALAVVRASEKLLDGKGVDNIVSWNHIMDWLMGQKDPAAAYKVYNEMKKRGHRPDAHTYTIMIRGYRENIKKPNAVKNAVSIYDSISAKNSAVEPSTIHTNAVLDVCGRGGDLDSMWIIAGRLPERGAGAPDCVSFTTILNAISADAKKRAVELSVRDGSKANTALIFDQAVQDGRKLWVDITTRWRKGDLEIDERLVCAMGRLMMLSTKRKDHEQVFALVNQTMRIPIPKQTSSNQEVADTEPAPEGQDAADQAEIDPETEHGAEDTASSDSLPNFTPVVPADVALSDAVPTGGSIYARPGNNTLAMLIETATGLHELGAGKKYWDWLTSPVGYYKLAPDHGSITCYLRLLRLSRSSKEALDILRHDWPEEVREHLLVRGTFVIAMSTCVRDKNNPNVFDTASRILDLMQQHADVLDEDPDRPIAVNGQTLAIPPKILTMYLKLALATTKGLNGVPLQRKEDGDLDFERDARENNALRALTRLGPEMLNVKRLVKLHVVSVEAAARNARTTNVGKLIRKGFVDPNRVGENAADMAEFLRAIIGAYDKLVRINERLEDEGMGPLAGDWIQHAWSTKRKLSAFLEQLSSQIRRGKGEGAWETYDDGGMESEERSEEASDDEGPEDGDFSGPLDWDSARTKLDRRVQHEISRREKQAGTRHLSRRQKMELEREAKVRAQFPESALRERTPAAKGPGRKKREVSKSSRASREDARRMHSDMTYSARPHAPGSWGGGFQEMVKKGSSGSGLIDLSK